MKKSVIISIIAVYLLSIFVVGYFGMNIAVYDVNVYVTDIEILKVTVDGEECEIKTNSDGEMYMSVDYTEDLVVFIHVKVNPDDATVNNVRFSIEENNTIATIDEEKGYLTFHKPGPVTVTIRATDQNKVVTSIIIRAKA